MQSYKNMVSKAIKYVSKDKRRLISISCAVLLLSYLVFIISFKAIQRWEITGEFITINDYENNHDTMSVRIYLSMRRYIFSRNEYEALIYIDGKAGKKANASDEILTNREVLDAYVSTSEHDFLRFTTFEGFRRAIGGRPPASYHDYELFISSNISDRSEAVLIVWKTERGTRNRISVSTGIIDAEKIRTLRR